MVVQLADKFPKALRVDRSPFWGQLRACSGSSRLNSRRGADSFANCKLDDNGGCEWRQQTRECLIEGKFHPYPKKEQDDRPVLASLNQSKRGAYTYSYMAANKSRTEAAFPDPVRISAAKTLDISNHANFLCDQSEMPPADPLSPRAGSGWNPVGDLAGPFRSSRPFERKTHPRDRLWERRDWNR